MLQLQRYIENCLQGNVTYESFPSSESDLVILNSLPSNAVLVQSYADFETHYNGEFIYVRYDSIDEYDGIKISGIDIYEISGTDGQIHYCINNVFCQKFSDSDGEYFNITNVNIELNKYYKFNFYSNTVNEYPELDEFENVYGSSSYKLYYIDTSPRYDVTINANGGTGTSTLTDKTEITTDDLATIKTQITRDGYILTGLSETSAGSAVTLPYTLTADKTMYCVWTTQDNLQTKTTKLITYAKSQLSSKGVTSTATTLRGALDDIVNISAGGTQATLNAPTISLSGSILTLTNPATNGNFATGFNIYNGSALLATQLIDVTTLDLSTLLTEEGTYTITAKCYGTNMSESNASSSVSYVVALLTSNQYLTFESEDNLAFTLKTYNESDNWNGTLEYSTDTASWSTWDGTLINSSSNGKLYLRGTNNTYITGSREFDEDDFEIPHNFVFGGSSTKIQCNGNIENLLDYSTVANGQHPTMADYCYYDMFSGCTSLTTAPELPATTLTVSCYESMFSGCTSLTTTPSLPATTLAERCYYYMFDGCTSLTTTPSLPSTTLAVGCYESMFYGCTSLTTVPELTATTLADYCYREMFSNCTSLTTAPSLPATILAERCYYYMFDGCTSLTTTPSLPSTTLAVGCYESMFSGCTSLTTAPELPATTLTVSCYESMFSGCTSLKVSSTQTSEYQYAWRIPTSGTGTTATDWNYHMLSNTGGLSPDDPEINTTYYTTNQPV